MHKYDLSEFVARSSDRTWEQSSLYHALAQVLPAVSLDGPWIAGGSLRRLIVGQEPMQADVDYFFKNQEQYNDWVSEMRALEHAREVSKTDHAISFEVVVPVSASTSRGKDPDGTENEAEFDVEPKMDVVKVQGIHFQYYDSIEAVIDSFDFTITQLGYDGKDLYTGDHTLWDLGRKKLALNKLSFGVSTVRRLMKYSLQGFTACAGCLTQILASVAENPELIQSKVQYVD